MTALKRGREILAYIRMSDSDLGSIACSSRVREIDAHLRTMRDLLAEFAEAHPINESGHDIEAVPDTEGIGQCKICGGTECEIPTHCPGRAMTPEQKQEVCNGHTDFKDGKWFNPKRAKKS